MPRLPIRRYSIRMKDLSDILRRNRTVIASVTAMVILPSAVLGLLAFRAIRSEDVQQQFQQRQRQQEIAVLLEADLKNWLFSQGSPAAISQALLRFTVDGERIVFPDFQVAIPQGQAKNPVPFDTEPGAIPDMKTLQEIYYPRIQAFIRDFKTSQNSGAQYFRRLKAMIVQIPGTPNGYVLGSSQLLDYSTRRLDDLTRPEDFRGVFSIAESGDAPTPGAEVVLVNLNDFTFFQIAFSPKTSPGFNIRRNVLLYALVLLTLATVMGIVFMYRAVSHEMSVSQLRTDFVSAVSHEFRTPLSTILALLERLESGRVSEPTMQQRYHQSLRQEARRLGLLVDKLLDFAQLEEGKKKFSFARVDLGEITAEAANVFEGSSFAARLELNPSTRTNETCVDADRTAIIQCIQNLIENALKYSTPESKVQVRYGEKDDAAFVEVIDCGIGVDNRDKHKIFDKFYRAENARALSVQGAGIGLALVKGIMERHGGSVVVESGPGLGSRFRLNFPKSKGGA